MSATLAEVLQIQTAVHGDATCFTYIDGQANELASLSYGALDRRARAIAATLQETSRPGDRALLLYPPGLELIGALFGCAYAGVVAVLAYPPRRNAHGARVQGIVANAEPSAILATSEVRRDLASNLPWFATDTIGDDVATAYREHITHADDLALLQYTSGSTAQPRGVMVSHRNLLHNLESIRCAFELDRDSVSVTWLPSYHDMGLIDGILEPVYGGFRGYVMAPVSFLQRPVGWLEAISRYRATHSGGPNFAYELCVAKTATADRERLDLSCWVSAYNGAEPVRAATLRRFATTFEPCGFRSRFWYPCYGLAEATLMVTGGAVSNEPIVRQLDSQALARHRVAYAVAGDADASEIVACGQVHDDTRVVIVDPETRVPCEADRVGEIWIAGGSVALGYWRQREETEGVFGARLAGGADGPYLRTGDLGFIRDRELFVTGRLKDLIILRGRNYYPQDLELAAEQAHPALRTGCSAAFTVPYADGERIAVVHEVERGYARDLDAPTVATAVRRAIAEHHELSIHGVAFVGPGKIPKTSSGKIQRHACRAAYLSNTLEEIARDVLDAPDVAVADLPSPAELRAKTKADRAYLAVTYLRKAAERILRVRIDTITPLVCFGLDSLGATELEYGLVRDFGVTVGPARFLDDVGIDVIGHEVAVLLDADPQEVAGWSTANADVRPLSRGQESLWFLQRTAPDSAAYNVVFSARIISPLDISMFQRAFELLTARHPALRTTIANVSGGPVQRLGSASVVFAVADASAWTTAELDGYLSAHRHRAFDLEHGPLWRVHVCHRGPDDHILLIVAHHIVTDAWSLELVLFELGAAYAAAKRGAFAPPPLADWQLREHANSLYERQWAYWREQLRGASSVLELPTDRPRPAIQSYRGATMSRHWDCDLVARVRTAARSHEATLYTYLLAGFAVQLHRFTAQDDISVGSSVDGRTPDQADVVGYFVNQVVVRIGFAQQMTFADVVRAVKRTVLDALTNKHLPFPSLVERLNPERDPSRSPLFSVMFVHQKGNRVPGLAAVVAGVPDATIRLGELLLTQATVPTRTAQFDLTVTILEHEAGLTARWEYSTDLFDAATIDRMDRSLQTLVAASIAAPGSDVGLLPILDPSERDQLVNEWNRTQVTYPENRCVPTWFAAQARRTPDAIAVEYRAERWTYRDLAERVSLLASFLGRRGIGREAVVGVCVERSLDMVVAVLAVLQTGAAYVPLDPTHPPVRLAGMLHAARAALVLTQQRLADRTAAPAVNQVFLDADWAIIAAGAELSPSAVCAEDLAYVIFTSGSTGTPKGAMITHRGLANYLSWCIEAYRVAEGCGSAVSSSIGFDATVTSLFAPLLVGGCVTLLPEQDELAALAHILQFHEELSLIKITPAHLELLRQYLPATGNTLRTRAMIVGGEALSPASIAYWQKRAATTRIINEYGPTETVVGCCTYDATALATRAATVPIGRPIANTQLYVLDRQRQPVPIGVIGELYIGGAGVARGYIGRDDLTAAAFIAHPFEPDARLYKTGDLARYRADGILEFVGRGDAQVKVRGFRIEPAEIETIVRRQAGIRDCVVIAARDDVGDVRLIAYVVPDGEWDHRRTSELCGALAHELPRPMIPSSIVALRSIPLTVQGKVDHRALPAPDRFRPLSTATTPPANELERIIASAWRDILELDEVGIHDNFFDLGGHSLLLARVHQRLCEELPQQAGARSIIELFQFPTIASLANHLGGGPQQSAFDEIHDRLARRARAKDRK